MFYCVFLATYGKALNSTSLEKIKGWVGKKGSFERLDLWSMRLLCTRCSLSVIKPWMKVGQQMTVLAWWRLWQPLRNISSVPLFVCCYVRWLLFSSHWSQKLSQLRVVGVTCAASVFPCLDKLKFPVCSTVIQHYLNTERAYKWRLSGSARQSKIGILCFDWLIHPGVSYSREIRTK